jgi:WhiB family transcriptional regulator, redox-sensing transcriptional regulator
MSQLTRKNPPSWFRRGGCSLLAPAIFILQDEESVAAAKAVCASCPIRLRCRQFILKHPHAPGTWGGLSENERGLHCHLEESAKELPRRPAP